MSYPVEQILDPDKLFYRIHIVNIDTSIVDEKKKIKPVAFDPQPRPMGKEMSVDWSKYSTPIDSRNRAKVPEKNGIVSFVVFDVRQSPTPLNVEHRPTHNQAHSIIFDVLPDANEPEIRIKLRRICVWEIPV